MDGETSRIALKMPHAGVLSVMACSIKGNVKDIFLPSPDAQV